MILRIQDKSTLPVEDARMKGIGFAVHGEETRKALEKQGVIFDDKAPVVLHQLPSFAVEPVKGKLNVLYTAFESEDLPEMYVEGAKKVDLILCTSDFVTKTYKRALPNKEVATVPLGVDVNKFEYKKRKYEEPFIYLWVGAPDPRKGYDLILKAWHNGGFANRSDCGLVLKTTKMEEGEQEMMGNIIIESRKVSTDELVKIYKIAHCFIFPSLAEGFGLPLAEAMATGLPCIFTPYGGVTQFANKKNAFPLKYNMVPLKYGVDTKGAQADVTHLINQMKHIKEHYKICLTKGKNARRHIEKAFTWEDTARSIKSYIERYVRYGTIN